MKNQEIEQIRNAADIVKIISSYDVALTQKGKNYFGVCPFHEDHSPSMSVSTEKQIYKCFACGAAGNVFTFVKEYENISFLEAVKVVADKCGLSFKGQTKPSKNITNKVEYEIMDLALKFYQNNLNTEQGKKAEAYLEERKLSKEAIKTFDIGLALNDSSLNKLLLSKNYSLENLLSLGLITRSKDYINDVFLNRIIFPIHDLQGRPIGFTGRIYEPSNQAKYVNSKESPIFKKGQIMFNYHRALSEIKKKREVIIVEGNMDAIRLYDSGVKNVVALMGTSLTKDQVTIIKNLRSKIILMFDNDNAGEEATLNNGNILESHGLTPYVVRLSNEKDPDEYIIKNGVNAIIDNINNPLSFIEYKLKYYKKNKDLTKTNDLVTYLKAIIESLSSIDDDLTKELTIKKISEEYDVPLELLKNELAKSAKPPSSDIPSPKTKTNLLKPQSKYEQACENILYYMMCDSSYILQFQKDLGYFTTKKYRNLANEIIYYYNEYQTINLASFISYLNEQDSISSDGLEIISNTKVEELDMTSFSDLVQVAKKEATKAEIKSLKEQIKNELDENQKIKLANKIIELKKGCVGK